MSVDFRDRAGRPMPLEVWVEQYEHFHERLIADDTVGDFTITTAWQGFDPNDENLPPLIFGTLVTYEGKEMDEPRWASEGEARVGHAVLKGACERITAALAEQAHERA
jgi:hypothetical protein